MKKTSINTPLTMIDRLMQSIANNFTELERKNIGKRVRKALKQKAEQGEYPFKAPLGYKNVTDSEGKHKIKVDEKIASFIKTAFELRADGMKVKDIAEKLYSDGLRNRKGNKVPTLSLKDILQNPIYMGKFSYQDKMYKGNYEPIISEELFKQAQNQRNRKLKFNDKSISNVVIYARSAISNDYSIEVQVNTNNEFAENNGYNVLKIFTDNGKPAKTLERSALKEMIEYCKNSKNKVDAVIVSRLDHLTRNFKDYQEILTNLFEKHKIKLISVMESNNDIPKKTLIHNICIALADYESKFLKRIYKL